MRRCHGCWRLLRVRMPPLFGSMPTLLRKFENWLESSGAMPAAPHGAPAFGAVRLLLLNGQRMTPAAPPVGTYSRSLLLFASVFGSPSMSSEYGLPACTA